MKRRYLLVLISLCTLAGCGQPLDFVSEESVAEVVKEVGELATEAPISKEAEKATAEDPAGEFSIYIVREGISVQQMMENDLGDLEVENTPIISVEGLISYTEKTHSIELTDAAYEDFVRLEVPVNGLPFVVYVGREPVYGGAFWATYSSLSFSGIVIETLPAMDKRPIRIQLGYPESLDLFTGKDLRSDSRILLSLDAAGKLR